MITKYELGLIAEKLSEENFFESDAASAGEITSVVYRCDALDCGGASAWPGSRSSPPGSRRS